MTPADLATLRERVEAIERPRSVVELDWTYWWGRVLCVKTRSGDIEMPLTKERWATLPGHRVGYDLLPYLAAIAEQIEAARAPNLGHVLANCATPGSPS